MSEMTAGPVTNGSGATALLAAGVGGCVLGLFALVGAAVPTVVKGDTCWTPTGPPSGVTTAAILVRLVTWTVPARLWKARDVNMGRVGLALGLLMLGGLVMTCPPAMDLIQGK